MSRHQRSLSTRFAALRPTRPTSVRFRLAAAGVALLAATGGTAVALTSGDDTPTTPVGLSRQDDRASRNEQRELAATSPSATPTVTPTPKVTTPAPKPKTTTKAPTTRATTKVTIPASCSAYKGNRAIACALLPTFGFTISQMPALDKLWQRESGWNTTAANSSSGAYGIPQALPGSKMGTVASDWRTNPATQIKWGLGYIKGRYGSPNNAWAHSQSHGWY